MPHHKQIKSIQALRAVAASLLCIMHFVLDQPSSGPEIIFAKRLLVSIGNCGVDLFFVISGFIITWIVMKEAEIPAVKSGCAFIIKRFFRIFPLFWFTLLFMAGLSFHNNGVVTEDIRQMLDFKVIFLMTTYVPLQYSAWTLCYELYFYITVFVFVCFCQRRYFLHFFTIWAFINLSLTGLIFYIHLNKTLDFFTNYLIFDFYFGLLIGYFLYHFKGYIVDKYLAIVVGIIFLILIATMIFYDFDLTRWEKLLFQGGSASLLVYGIVGLEHHRAFPVPALLQKLGDISYSIYLLGFPVLGIVTYLRFHYALWGFMNPFVRILADYSILLFLSYFTYKWIETPFIRLSKKIVARL